eukprot:6210827-Alexandrium_andersonii.AAC.1
MGQGHGARGSRHSHAGFGRRLARQHPEVQDFDEAMAYVGHMRAIETTVADLADVGAKVSIE